MSSTSAESQSQPRLLLVDDDVDVLVTLEAILQAEGYDVLALGSAAAALAALRDAEFDVIMADLHIETNDEGLSLLAQARESSPHTQGIILTGQGSMTSAIEALRLGAANYLLKPCPVPELKLSVALALEKAGRQKAEAAVRTRDDFICAAVHDLKNPLMAIRGWATILENRARRAPEGDKLADGLLDVQGLTRRMEAVVDELLEVSQLQMGESMILNKEPIGLEYAHRVVAEHGGSLQVRSVEGKGSTFTMTLPLQAAAAEVARVTASVPPYPSHGAPIPDAY